MLYWLKNLQSIPNLYSKRMYSVQYHLYVIYQIHKKCNLMILLIEHWTIFMEISHTINHLQKLLLLLTTFVVTSCTTLNKVRYFYSKLRNTHLESPNMHKKPKRNRRVFCTVWKIQSGPNTWVNRSFSIRQQVGDHQRGVPYLKELRRMNDKL